MKKIVSRLFARVQSKLKNTPQAAIASENGLSDRARITQIFRNPPQLALIKGQLQSEQNDKLRIAIHGVADGAEALSVLMALDPLRSGYQVSIEGCDIAKPYLAHAAQFVYTETQLPTDVWQAYFTDYLERDAQNNWLIKPEWQSVFQYDHKNVLDIEITDDNREQYDLVMFQNALISMRPEDLPSAVKNLVDLVRPNGLLAVGGGSLDLVPALVMSHGFKPVLHNVEEVHEAWTIQRQFYDNPSPPYWALEPYNAEHPDGAARYCTLFQKQTA